jgi:hypothetical protein
MPNHNCLLGITTWLMICTLPVLASAQISFAPAQNYPLTAAPFRVVGGDLNGDGKPDLVVLSIYGGTVSTLLNHGDGTFAPPRGFAALTPDPAGPTSFSGITLGDVNGDHKLDVILAHTTDLNSGDGIINVLLGNGDGTLQSPISTPIGSFAYRFVGVGDFNSDGRLDVACIADDPANTMQLVVLFLGNGDGTFVRNTSSQPALYVGPYDAELADLNHDQKLDFVMVAQAQNASQKNFVGVYLGNGDGTLQAPLQAVTPQPTFDLSIGDFNHDGTPDLVTTSDQLVQCIPDPFNPRCTNVGPPGSANLLLGNGDGTFKGPGKTFSGDYGLSVVGDFDGDGNLDFAAAQKSERQGYLGTFDFFLGDGVGNMSPPTHIVQPIIDLFTADLDGDGFADLVWPTSSSLQVALNDSSTFSLISSDSGVPIPAGGTARYTISVTQQHGQSATVTFTCAVPAGSHISCSVSPQSVAAGATATLNVTTAGPSAGLVLPVGRSHQLPLYAAWLPLGAVFFAGVGLSGAPLWRRKLPALTVGCLLLVGLVSQVACGGEGNSPIVTNNGTRPGTYAITVTGTAGTISRSTAVNLTVQ